jgi:hypothetical protein
MPNLDVSFMTKNPMLSDFFQVDRRADVVGTNGRTTPTIVKTFRRVPGVITQQDPADLIRNDDGQYQARIINICTTFALRGVHTAGQPDLVTWSGSTYVIKHVVPYSRFGQGTYEATAESMVAVEPAQ